MRVEEVLARVDMVPALNGRVHGALQLSALMARNALAQVSPAAFVIPLGQRGGAADAAAGLFRQAIDEVVGVLLVLRAPGDATGASALDGLSSLIDAVIAVVAGWGPDNAIGVFRLSRSELVSLVAGTLVYQLDFSIDDQLRIPT